MEPQELSWITKSPFGDDVVFFVTSDIMEMAAGMERVNRLNILDLRVPLESDVELPDRYYLFVMNMSDKPVRFKVSGPVYVEPVPEPEPVIIDDQSDPVADPDDSDSSSTSNADDGL